MRRKDRLLPDDETMSIIEQGEYGVLSTVSPSNEPYGVPVNYCFFGNNIYFHCAVAGQKLDNITNNSKVSFCIVGKTKIQPENFATQYESCIVQGTAVEVVGAEKQLALERLIKKYSSGFELEGLEYIIKVQDKAKVIKIIPLYCTGKAKR